MDKPLSYSLARQLIDMVNNCGQSYPEDLSILQIRRFVINCLLRKQQIGVVRVINNDMKINNRHKPGREIVSGSLWWLHWLAALTKVNCCLSPSFLWENSPDLQRPLWRLQAVSVDNKIHQLHNNTEGRFVCSHICRHLGFDVTRNSRPWKPYPTLPYPRTKHVVYWITRCGDMAIRVSWGHMEPPFWGEGEVVGGQQWHHSKERWWFPIGHFTLWPLRYL